MKCDIHLQGFGLKEIRMSKALYAKDKKMTNQYNHNAVIPKENNAVSIEDDCCIAEILPLSFNVIRLGI